MSGTRIELRTAPHAHAPVDVPLIMRHVIYALLPIVAWSVWLFGLGTLLLILTVTATALATERLLGGEGGERSIRDGSAVITGLLLALTLPPAFPLWMGVVAAVAAIGLGKMLFGGLGMNPLNPALVGRAFVQAAFPASITTWIPPLGAERFTSVAPSTLAPPFLRPEGLAEWIADQRVDAFTGATPLGLFKFDGVITPLRDLLAGTTAGSAGETPALLIVACGLYLAFRRFLDWRIPLAVMAGVVLAAGPLHLLDAERFPDPWFMLLSGGLMLGAWFMATDMVGSPVTPWGVLIYGLLIGLLTVVIRLFGGLSEGVMYAILLANAATPLIERLTQPRVFGAARRKE
ncbi:MAG TPA: RnfABCDGE type electron transport complex subunit D [Thiotrichales bacterium]|nr:RnfABCDGE type electron transport complex subunit D [Thiotrichales bacterium]